MGLQNASNGGALLNKIFVTGTFNTNGQVPTYTNGQFNPGTGGGGGTWGSITGTLSNQTDLQTALNGKQSTITTGTTSQYLRGNLTLSSFSTDALAVTLAGVVSTAGTIASTDTILGAFGKTLKGLADVNIRVDNLTTPNTGFFNGGEGATQNRTFGNTTNFAIGLITNNTQRLKVTGSGLVNITNGNEYAVPNNFVQPGSLVISGRNNSYGGGTGGWNTNTAQVILEFTTSTEIAGEVNGIGLTSFIHYEHNATSPSKRLTFGRDMGNGRTQIIRTASNSILHAHTDFSITSFSSYLATADRPNITIGGNNPHLFLISQGNTVGSNSNAIKVTTVGSDTIHRHLNEGQRNDGKYYSIAYYEGTDYNPHNNLGNNAGTIQYVMPGYSTSNVLTTALGVGVNIEAASINYNLHIRGTDNTNGTIGWGLNDGCRTEIKNDANSTDRIGKQSGFFKVTSPSNYFTGSNSNTVSIDCRYDNASYGLQLAGNIDNDDLWTRKIGRTWYKLLTTYNGWSRLGNDLTGNTSDNKIGSTSTHDVTFISNNIEMFRLSASNPRSIQIDTNGGFGSASSPNYAFRGNSGETSGLYYKATSTLGFSTGSTERLTIDSSTVTTQLPINISGSTQELRINGTKVVGTRGAAISTVSNTATGAELATAINALINRMQTHGLTA